MAGTHNVDDKGGALSHRAPRGRLPPEPDFIPRERWFALLPRRSLAKIVALLVLLAAVIYFRARAGTVIQFFGKSALPVQPGPKKNSAGEHARPAGTRGNPMPSSPP